MKSVIEAMGPLWLPLILAMAITMCAWALWMDRGPQEANRPRTLDAADKEHANHFIFQPMSFGVVKVAEACGGAYMGYACGFPWYAIIATTAFTPILLTIWPGTGTERIKRHDEV